MRNLLKAGENFLAARQRRSASELVTYARSDASVAVRAIRGKSDFTVEDASGLQIPVTGEDFLVYASELVIDAAPLEPKSGDRITDSDGVVYEVSSPGPGIDAWIWAEPTHLRYRIHTKQVS